MPCSGFAMTASAKDRRTERDCEAVRERVGDALGSVAWN